MNLVRPQIEARPSVGFHSSLLSKMSFILSKEVEPTPTNTDMLPRHGQTKKRCEISEPCQKKKKDKLQKLKSRCQKCGTTVCEQHSKLIFDKRF